MLDLQREIDTTGPNTEIRFNPSNYSDEVQILEESPDRSVFDFYEPEVLAPQNDRGAKPTDVIKILEKLELFDREKNTQFLEELQNLTKLHETEFIRSGDEIHNKIYAKEIRAAFNEININALFCIQGVPHIAVLEQEEHNSDLVIELYEALWNQGLSSVLLVVTDSKVFVYSLLKSTKTLDKREFEKLCKIEDMKLNEAKEKIGNYIYAVESGRLWRDYPNHFDINERIDCNILNNMFAAKNLLSKLNLSLNESKALILQSTFASFLEDRGIITINYISNATNGNCESLFEILNSESYENLRNLFEQLSKDFHGDLFISPMSFEIPNEQSESSADSLKVVSDLLFGDKELSTGQDRLFGYKFRYLPIELLVDICEQFLNQSEGKLREAVPLYSASLLVESTLSTVWKFISDRTKLSGTFLDPACGTGLFLVRSFQRMCEEFKHKPISSRSSYYYSLEWEELNKIVNRIHGSEISPIRIRIALFSLHMAMLEESHTKDLELLTKQKKLLPKLLNSNLVCENIFDKSSDSNKFDVILGNPTESLKSELKRRGEEWCKNESIEITDTNISIALLRKISEYAKFQGFCALLLPAGMLYTEGKETKSRNTFFTLNDMCRIIDFSDFRNVLPKFATSSIALLAFFHPRNSEGNNEFEFWVPKYNMNPQIKQITDVVSIDQTKLSNSYVEMDEFAFFLQTWIREPELKLFSYIDRLPKLSRKLNHSTNASSCNENSECGWTISVRNPEPDVVPSSIAIAINNDGNSKTAKSQESKENNSVGPRVQISQFLNKSADNSEEDSNNYRILVNYLENVEVSGDHRIPDPTLENDINQAKLLTALLKSSFARWYYFHSTNLFMTANQMITPSQIQRFPFPDPENLSNFDNSLKAKHKLIEIVDQYSKEFSKIRAGHSSFDHTSFDETDELASEIDELVFDYFCLTSKLRMLVEDTTKFVLPSIQPTGYSTPPIWENCSQSDRHNYLQQLVKHLDSRFGNRNIVSGEIIGKNDDIAIVKLTLHKSSQSVCSGETEGLNCMSKLHDIIERQGRQIFQDTEYVYNIKVFDEDNLYFIKPLQLRYWLRSIAIAEASDILSDLESSRNACEHRERI